MRIVDWLKQFEDRDQASARLLIGSLDYVSANDFGLGLKRILAEVVDSSSVEEPIAIYAAREVDGPYFADRKRRPLPSPSAKPGSEAACAFIATQCERQYAPRVISHPPIMTLKKRRVRRIVVIDDYVGSGTRVARFIRSMLSNDTTRSWHSYHLLEFVVAAYAVTEASQLAIRELFAGTRKRAPHSYQLKTVTVGHTLSSVLTNDELLRVQAFLLKYSGKFKMSPMFSLGYKANMGTTIFEHGCPNNVPGLLWSPARGYAPLFPNRAVPSEISSSAIVESALLSEKVRSIGAPPEARLSADQQRTLTVLWASSRQIPKTLRARASNLTQAQFDSQAQAAKSAGFLDESGRITDRGREELRAAARAEPRDSEKRIDKATDFYFSRG